MSRRPGAAEGDGDRAAGHRTAAHQSHRHAGDTQRARTASRSRCSRLHARPWDSLVRGGEAAVRAAWRRCSPDSSATPSIMIGRMLDYLEDTGQLDNTLVVVVSDNGASGEGGPNGSVNENKFFNGIPDDLEENMQMLDQLGGPTTYNHYCDRLGDGLQHAVQAVETLYSLQRGHRRRLHHLAGRGNRRHAARFATNITMPSTSCRPCWIAWASSRRRDQRLSPRSPIEGVSMRYSFARCRAPHATLHAVLFHARFARDLPRRMESDDRPTRPSPAGGISWRITGSCTIGRCRPLGMP